ncbi:hypothetical protein SH580_17675 [Coraliomargarita algicola]|uniref:DUF4145 domain-containing protein n=1 Tax=Coraliomargarita algicola TaxID=3092156 RepID=A0ABZ0RKF0_9BACT|nr:hypothetical protein [Coraliomargarita sp. J2-16]WPJ95255.1 hypothetical protein SH580_17675 [Coraliomargarita sp. J2-16]
MSKIKAIHFLATTGIALGIAAISYTYLKRQYSVLKAQEIAPDAFSSKTIERFLIEDKNHDNAQRLSRAFEFLPTENDVAGMLAFTAFERHITEICSLRFKAEPPKRGLLNLIKKLRSANVLSREKYESIKAHVCDVRNPMFHGDVYCPNKLKASLAFIKKFMEEYPISRFAV